MNTKRLLRLSPVVMLVLLCASNHAQSNAQSDILFKTIQSSSRKHFFIVPFPSRRGLRLQSRRRSLKRRRYLEHTDSLAARDLLPAGSETAGPGTECHPDASLAP